MTWEMLDPAIQDLFRAVHGEDAQAVWEQENTAANAPLMTVGGQPYGPLQDYGAADMPMYGDPNPQYPANAPVINPDGSVGGVTPPRPASGGPWWNTPNPAQQNPLGTEALGKSMYWADNAATIPGHGQVVSRNQNMIRYQDGFIQWAPAGSGYDPATGRIIDQSQLAAFSSPYRYRSATGANLQGEWAPLADYYMRSDQGPNGTGVTTEPIPAEIQALMDRAIAQGVVTRTGSGPQAAGGGAAGASGAAGAAGAGAFNQANGVGAAGDEATFWQNRAKIEQADQAAKLVYQDWLMRTGNDKLALEKAGQAWQQKFSERQQDFTEGQAGKNFGLAEAGLTGMYGGKPTFAREQADKSFGLAEAGVTGRYQGQATLAREGQENQTALSLLNLNAGLRGPSNYLSYLRTLSNTPQGLTSLVNNLAGKYGQVSTQQGTVPGSTFERQSIGTLVRDLNGAPAGANDASGVALPAGNQWNAVNTAAMLKSPTQAGLLRNLYEERGSSFDDEYANFLSSLPRYGGARSASVAL